MDIAFDFIQKKGGITTETNYPYEAEDGTCDVSKVHNMIQTPLNFLI